MYTYSFINLITMLFIGLEKSRRLLVNSVDCGEKLYVFIDYRDAKTRSQMGLSWPRTKKHNVNVENVFL